MSSSGSVMTCCHLPTPCLQTQQLGPKKPKQAAGLTQRCRQQLQQKVRMPRTTLQHTRAKPCTPSTAHDRMHSAAAHFATPRRSAASSASVQRWLGRSRTTVVPDGGMLAPLGPAK